MIESFEKPATSVMAPAGMVSVYSPPSFQGAEMCQRSNCAVSGRMCTGTSSIDWSPAVKVSSSAAESSRARG